MIFLFWFSTRSLFKILMVQEVFQYFHIKIKVKNKKKIMDNFYQLSRFSCEERGNCFGQVALYIDCQNFSTIAIFLLREPSGSL